MAAGGGPRARRRDDGLNRAAIVRAAVEVLDEGGAAALTYRALAARLRTGPGALYHHVASKDELMQAAAATVVGEHLGGVAPADGGQPSSRRPVALRDVMADAYTALTDHPWLAVQLAAAPWQPAVLTLLDRVGCHLGATGVRAADQFNAASLLVQHVLASAGQYAAVLRLREAPTTRTDFLERALDGPGAALPFLDRIRGELVEHDDREQFFAGVDIILAGLAALRCEPVDDGARGSGVTRAADGGDGSW